MQFGANIPFVGHLGVELVQFDGGHSEVRYQTRPEHCNSLAMAHGGLLMTLLDVAMATAARSVNKETGVLTIEMKTSFMRPARGILSGKGRLMHRTATMAFTEATVVDSHGHACAHATGTYRYASRPAHSAAGGSGPNVISTD